MHSPGFFFQLPWNLVWAYHTTLTKRHLEMWCSPGYINDGALHMVSQNSKPDAASQSQSDWTTALCPPNYLGKVKTVPCCFLAYFLRNSKNKKHTKKICILYMHALVENVTSPWEENSQSPSGSIYSEPRDVADVPVQLAHQGRGFWSTSVSRNQQGKRLDAGGNKTIWQHIVFAANLRFF